MITDSNCVGRFGNGYSLSRYKALPWTHDKPPDANIVQTKGGAATFVASVQTDCIYPNPTNYLTQRKVGQEQKNKFEIYLGKPDAINCTDLNAVCRYCPLPCSNGGVCKFDVNDEPVCDCSMAFDTARDCFGYYDEGTTYSGIRDIRIPYSGKFCEVPPAGLPNWFVTDFHNPDHGQCFSTHKDYTNGQNGGCAPGLRHQPCTGDYHGPIQANICTDQDFLRGGCGQG